MSDALENFLVAVGIGWAFAIPGIAYLAWMTFARSVLVGWRKLVRMLIASGIGARRRAQ